MRLRRREEPEKDWDPARNRRLVDWERAQHLVRTVTAEAGDSVAEAARLALGPARAENARALAYRLHAVSERKGWTGEAWACNILVASWPQIRARAAELAAGGPAQAEVRDQTRLTLRARGSLVGFGCAPSRAILPYDSIKASYVR